MTTLAQQFNTYALQDPNNIDWAFYSDSDYSSDDFEYDDPEYDDPIAEYRVCEYCNSTDLEDPVDCI